METNSTVNAPKSPLVPAAGTVAVSADLKPGQPTYAELQARLVELEAQSKAQPKSGAVGFSISEKGCISLSGLGRFPVSLYVEQWEKLRDNWEPLWAFINANDDGVKLSRKTNRTKMPTATPGNATQSDDKAAVVKALLALLK